jgi:hypothetical protein
MFTDTASIYRCTASAVRPGPESRTYVLYSRVPIIRPKLYRVGLTKMSDNKRV